MVPIHQLRITALPVHPGGGKFAAEIEQAHRAVACGLTLHAWMLSQSGIPVIYSGDEVGQLNDWGYREIPEKQADSRYIHRGDFRWEKPCEAVGP